MSTLTDADIRRGLELDPPADFSPDPEGADIIGAASYFTGPRVQLDPDGPGAQLQWTPELGLRVTFDVVDGKAYRFTDVLDWALALTHQLVAIDTEPAVLDRAETLPLRQAASSLRREPRPVRAPRWARHARKAPRAL
jgi:hypothetical protein